MVLPPVEDVELVNVNIVTEFKFCVVVFFNLRVGGAAGATITILLKSSVLQTLQLGVQMIPHHIGGYSPVSEDWQELARCK